MPRIRYLVGDATQPQRESPDSVVIVAHICNDAGFYGKGFAQAVAERWPKAKNEYMAWHRGRVPEGLGPKFELGAIQLVPVEPSVELWVANMIAQHGLRSPRNLVPLDWDALDRCLWQLSKRTEFGVEVHMPRIGSGLAGGVWDDIEPLIETHFCPKDIPVTVYDLEAPT